MGKVLVAISLLLTCVCVYGRLDVPIQNHCGKMYPKAGLSKNFHENIGHAIHSITVQGLRLFNPRATEKNTIPTVNHNVSATNKMIPFAPDDSLEKGHQSGYKTFSMNVVDKILSNVGLANDGLGPNWSPTERIAHWFHMWDLWETIRLKYDETVLWNPPSDDVCTCLLDTKNNGIYNAVEWVANHYESGTPITLLGLPIPKLTNAKSWMIWRERLLHYYNDQSLQDAAQYIYCATKDF